ncbi:hypothetical protein K438DRAFT_1768195 [Mycena galopus ATCC 62051]|nr:hypothetical protein K438DRAFT_1768195 [Mycena galopus ATCC 62051]
MMEIAERPNVVIGQPGRPENANYAVAVRVDIYKTDLRFAPTISIQTSGTGPLKKLRLELTDSSIFGAIEVASESSLHLVGEGSEPRRSLRKYIQMPGGHQENSEQKTKVHGLPNTERRCKAEGQKPGEGAQARELGEEDRVEARRARQANSPPPSA